MNELNISPEAKLEASMDLMAMFDNAPILDEEIDFDAALTRAASDAMDIAAFAAISQSFERAKAAGDFAQIQQMAMVLGATACMHDHLQAFSNALTSSFEPDIMGKKVATLDLDDDDDDETPASRRKRRKAQAKAESHHGHNH